MRRSRDPRGFAYPPGRPSSTGRLIAGGDADQLAREITREPRIPKVPCKVIPERVRGGCHGLVEILQLQLVRFPSAFRSSPPLT